MKVNWIVVFLLLCGSVADLNAIIKGSLTVVSVESNFQFPEDIGVLPPNEIRGFAWFKNGFSLENADTDLIYNALFSVSGTVDLNGGTLTLQEDLIFQNDTTLNGLGSIIGNGHKMQLCASIDSFPADAQEFTDTHIICDTNLTLNSAITFKGSSSICGIATLLRLAAGAEIIVDSNAQLVLRDMEIRGIKNDNIRCKDDTGTLVLENVRWVQSDSVTFDSGAIQFKDQVDFMGSSTFFYTSAYTSTIDICSQLTFDDGMHACLGRNTAALIDPLAFTDSSSTLKFDNSSFIVTSSGIQLTKGTLALDRKVNLDILSTSSDYGLIVGNGMADDDCTIWLNPGCAAWHNQGYVVYNNTTPDKLQSSSLTSRLIRNVDSQVFIPQDLTIDTVTLELLANTVSPMSVSAGKSLLYNNAAVVLPDVQFEIKSQQLNAITYLLTDNDQIFFTKGTLPLHVQISGQNNRLRGNGGVSGSITLLSSAAQLRCGHAFIDNAVTLNEGNLLLERDLLALANTTINGPGVFDLQSNQFTWCAGSVNANTPICWKGNGGILSFQGKVTLSSTWTISGKTTIDAHNNRIILDTGGQIVVDNNSELVLKNAEIHGVQGNNIRCLDETGRITLLNDNVLLDGNYSFTIGAMQFYRHNNILGSYDFSYDSPQTSTIKADAQLALHDDATLLIGRNNGNEPLAFEDSSAILKIDNSKLSIKNSGMNLLKGTIVSSRDVEVSIASNQESGSLVFGDGVPANDMKFVMSPGSTARFPTGHVTFNVTSGDGIKSKSKTAELIRGSASIFLLKQDLTLADMTIDVDPLSSLSIDVGKTLSYSNGRIVIDQGIFDLTGVRFSDTTSLLNGNDKIILVSGTLPLATLVNGTGNSIEGNGAVSGPIILQDSVASLTMGVAGDIIGNITLAGGTLTLSSDLNFSNNTLINSDGIVDMATYNIHLGKANLNWASNINWQGNNASLNLYSMIDLASTWTITGHCTIKGHGYGITFGQLGNIVVDSNAQLCLQNIKLENVSGSNIRCVDDTGCIVFDNVDWNQTNMGAYTFSNGAIQFKNKNVIRGENVFAYESNQTSTICTESRLKFDANMTFSYAPHNGDKTGLYMQAKTAQLVFDNADLVVSLTGLQLAQGTVIIRGDVRIDADRARQADNSFIGEGVLFGGSSFNDDCTLLIDIGSTLAMVRGSLIYNNLLDQSFIAGNGLSRLEIKQDTCLVLNKLLDLKSGHLVLHRGGKIIKNNGSKLIGSVLVK